MHDYFRIAYAERRVIVDWAADNYYYSFYNFVDFTFA